MFHERTRLFLMMTSGVLAAASLACGPEPERGAASASKPAPASTPANESAEPAAVAAAPAPPVEATPPAAASETASPSESPATADPAPKSASTAAPKPEAAGDAKPKPESRPKGEDGKPKGKAKETGKAADPDPSGFPRKIRLDDPAFKGGKFEGSVRSLFANKSMSLPLDLPPGKYKAVVTGTTNALLNGEPARYTIEVGSSVSGPLDTSVEGLKQEFAFEKAEGPAELKISFINDKSGVDETSQKRVDLNLYVRSIAIDKAG